MAEKLRLLLFNLATDTEDSLLGFTTQWINALAPHCEYIDVITTQAGKLELADNVRVYSTGREHGYSRARRVFIFYGLLARLLMTRRYDACFAHMNQIFALLAAPLLTLRGIRQTLWYTHRSTGRGLRWALRFSYRAVTAVESSFPIPSPKVRVLGHGVDTKYFNLPMQRPALEKPMIVHVARIMPIKHQETLIRALPGLEADAIFVGGVPDGHSTAYRDELIALADKLGVAENVHFVGDQNRASVRAYYQGTTVAVNLSPVGLFDKAPLEAMACGIPTIVTNPAFEPVLGEYKALLTIPSTDAHEALHERLKTLLALSPEERENIGWNLRKGVLQYHSLHQLARRLVHVLKTGELP
ncbi:MAG: glycosyltransferase [Chloroflexi bacterium]|nr:MAG: glycosyltransferase [Chloroflexota bacterium]